MIPDPTLSTSPTAPDEPTFICPRCERRVFEGAHTCIPKKKIVETYRSSTTNPEIQNFALNSSTSESVPKISSGRTDTERRAVHSTMWEDAQMAGVECDGQNVGTIAAYDRDEPWICSRCGAVLRLVWGVRLEEVSNNG